MDDRLKWMRDGDGFVAYPEKPGDKSHMAEIRHQLTMPAGNQWQWRVVYDGARQNGYAADRQAASDAANTAWPAARERAREIAAAAAAKVALTELIDRQYVLGTIPLDEFDIAGSTSDRLRQIISIASKHWQMYRAEVPPTLEPLISACSAELYRRRVAG